MCDSVVTRHIAMPNAAMNAIAASDTRERLAVPDGIDAGLRYFADGRMRLRRGSACSVHGQLLHSAQRPPVDVFHQDVCELAVSTNAVKTINTRGPLEALAIRLILVEKD